MLPYALPGALPTCSKANQNWPWEPYQFGVSRTPEENSSGGVYTILCVDEHDYLRISYNAVDCLARPTGPCVLWPRHGESWHLRQPSSGFPAVVFKVDQENRDVLVRLALGLAFIAELCQHKALKPGTPVVYVIWNVISESIYRRAETSWPGCCLESFCKRVRA